MEQDIYEIVSAVVSQALDAAGFTRFNEGGPMPDLANQAGPFAMVHIVIDDVTTVALGPTAPKRYSGAVEVGLFVRDGSGTAPIRAAKAELNARLINVYLGGKVLMEHQAIAMGSRSIPQWYGDGRQYLFSADETRLP